MTDKEILYPLAQLYAEVSSLQTQNLTASNWGKLNALKPARPTILIDQIPWHEMNVNDELTCLCADPFARSLEWHLRETLYKWNHFRGDMVLPPFIRIGKSYSDTGVGVGTINNDETGHINAQTHTYADQLPAVYNSDGSYNAEKALEKLHNHEIKSYPEQTAHNVARASELLSGLVPVKAVGASLWLAIWDRLTFMRGAEACLYSVIDEPEHTHALMKKLSAIEMDYIDQLEAENLLDGGEGMICHCMETYTDEEKWYNIDESNIKAKDIWTAGAAQIFSEVSPAMHDEFEIEYMKPIYERFGWVNYGCCEPLHKKIDIIKKISTVRAISTSPWANVYEAAEAMGKAYMMARKPNPSYVASGYPDIDSIKRETRETLKACVQNGTNVEFILKDITTVSNRPECLTEWYELVKSEIENF